jgi:hypothetical protein
MTRRLSDLMCIEPTRADQGIAAAEPPHAARYWCAALPTTASRLLFAVLPMVQSDDALVALSKSLHVATPSIVDPSFWDRVASPYPFAYGNI